MSVGRDRSESEFGAGTMEIFLTGVPIESPNVESEALFRELLCLETSFRERLKGCFSIIS